MKKILIVFSILALVWGLAGCPGVDLSDHKTISEMSVKSHLEILAVVLLSIVAIFLALWPSKQSEE